MGYYSDSDDEGAPAALIGNGTAPRASHTKPAAKSGAGKKDPAAERRARLLAQESEVRLSQTRKIPRPADPVPIYAMLRSGSIHVAHAGVTASGLRTHMHLHAWTHANECIPSGTLA